MVGGGDFVFDLARSAGLQRQDFSEEEILGSYIRGYETMGDGAQTIMGIAFKPPFGRKGSESCNMR